MNRGAVSASRVLGNKDGLTQSVNIYIYMCVCVCVTEPMYLNVHKYAARAARGTGTPDLSKNIPNMRAKRSVIYRAWNIAGHSLCNTIVAVSSR